MPYASEPFHIYVLVAVAATMGGLSRGFSGFGSAMVFMPIASATLTPIVATPVLLLTDIVSSSLLLRGALKQFCWQDVRWVLAGALIGFPLGLEILTRSDPVVVRWTASVIILASLAFLASGWRYRGPQTMPLTMGIGLASGTMGGVAQIGNPPIVAYWLGTEMPAQRMRANLIVYFSALTVVGIAIFASKGLITWKVAGLAAAALPGYILGMWTGNRVFRLASQSTFRRIAFVLIVASVVGGLPLLDPWLRR